MRGWDGDIEFSFSSRRSGGLCLLSFVWGVMIGVVKVGIVTVVTIGNINIGSKMAKKMKSSSKKWCYVLGLCVEDIKTPKKGERKRERNKERAPKRGGRKRERNR
jgi:hypothetical protein